MRADKAYDELIRRVREEELLTTIEALLEWDEETYMPSGGVENRSEQLALIAGLLHERGPIPTSATCSPSSRDPICSPTRRHPRR